MDSEGHNTTDATETKSTQFDDERNCKQPQQKLANTLMDAYLLSKYCTLIR